MTRALHEALLDALCYGRGFTVNTLDEAVAAFSIAPGIHQLPTIRDMLAQNTVAERARQGAGNTELMRFLCVLLFGARHLVDVERIWAAKEASFDAASSIDVQLLCGAGLEATKQYLRGQAGQPWAMKALARIVEGERSGDFEHFDPGAQLESFLAYYA